MSSALFAVGVAVAVFVGVNIGGSSTGVAFGPATGSDVLSMRQASTLMSVFVFVGGFTVGTNVVDTLGTGFVPPEQFTLAASTGVLLFIGIGILLGNVLRVSTSTSMTAGVALGAAAIGVGAFALGPRTMETVGDDITDLSLEAALVVETVAASIITGLSWAGIPVSLAVMLTTCVIGLGWGRASRRVPLLAIARPEGLTAGECSKWAVDQLDLYDPTTAKRIVGTWVATPTVAGAIAFVVFEAAQRFALLG